jgi:adenylate cyclase
MAGLELKVYENGTLRRQLRVSDKVEIGRQSNSDEPSPFALFDHPDYGTRLLVATTVENKVPRRWFRLSAQADGTVCIENIHEERPVYLSDGLSISPKQSWNAGREPLIKLSPGRVLRAEVAVEKGGSEYRNIPTRPWEGISPAGSELATFRAVIGSDRKKEEGEAFVGLLRQALRVVREAAGSDAFFREAVEAVTRIVGLDRAIILVPGPDSGWQRRAEFSLKESTVPAAPISDTLLQRVQVQGSTQIYDSRRTEGPGSSLRALNCAVASPILDHEEHVVGVLYGDRSLPLDSHEEGITDVEATLVEVLAGAVAAGIARQDQERSRTRLAEFFSPRVAEVLNRRPELLAGQDVEVTVLFCDIRGFSGVAEHVGPTKTIEWLNDVLSELSQCVVDRDGVLVDYVGDQVMAMWGAPQPQVDHARRALETAAAMQGAVRLLRERWKEQIPLPFEVGIGINTGMARVGNTGSRLKFKYGVLGNTVNVASRLQDATKQVGVRCMASSATIQSAKWQDYSRRLAVLNVVGIGGAVEVYETIEQPTAEWSRMRYEYEGALRDFEQRRFTDAVQKLSKLIEEFRDDRPSYQLFRRVAAELTEPSESFSPIWKLTSK